MTPTTDLQKLLAEATKGPWMALGTDPAEGVDCFWIAAFMRGFTKEIGSVNGSQNDPAQQANARLIAMAPDLAARVLELEAENKRLREGLAPFADFDLAGFGGSDVLEVSWPRPSHPAHRIEPILTSAFHKARAALKGGRYDQV
jgi:hypothetical protein